MTTRPSKPVTGCMRYICLAEYKCLCRPAGISVSLSTMLRHRKSANTRRNQLRLSKLPWGPQHTEQRGNEIYLRCRSLPSEEQADIEPYSFSALGNEPAKRRRLHVEDSRIRSIMSSAAPVNESPERISPPTEMPQMLTSDEVVDILGEIGEPSDESGSDGGHVVLDDEMDGDVDIDNHWNAKSYLAFKNWAIENKRWVETCVEFSVTGSLFDRILSNIDAPYTSITVKRNIIKYAKLCTQKFLCCRSHMLLENHIDEDIESLEDPRNVVCDICVSSGTTPELSTFEYIPLRPRILSWFRNESSYKDLTGYREEKRREREDNTRDSPLVYEDYFDGTCYKQIVQRCGGNEAVKNDLFLSLSTDGFQTFENQSYDCWPLFALNNNLHPSKRFLLKNVIPFGYIKGPHEPRSLDTFFLPLINELNEINRDGGMWVSSPDGSKIKVRVHVLWITADKQAKNKIAGLAGQNSKTPCEECWVQGEWCPVSRHYYFPSKVPREDENGNGRHHLEVKFDVEHLPMRSTGDVENVWQQFNSDPPITQAQRKALIRDTGIKPKTFVYRIESVTPFQSFPHDSMHHIMNVSKDLFELFKGENRHLARESSTHADEFVISSGGWNQIDVEIGKIGKGTSLDAFGPPPRATTHYRNYKAAEWKEFYCNYALVLFEGLLPRAYLKCLRHFCRVVELCRRPILTARDLDDLECSAKEFYRHMEERFYRYDRKRIGIMKSTLHSLLHLRGQVERYGPMSNYNQFWVERRLGDEKSKLNATIRAAESMAERAKLVESFKMFYDSPFAGPMETTADLSSAGSEATPDSIFEALLPCIESTLRDPFHRSRGTRELLVSYLLRKGMNPLEARNEVGNDHLFLHGRIRVPCGETSIVVGSLKTRRHKASMGRADWYVSAEFDYEDGSENMQVFYGRVLQVLRYRFASDSTDTVLLLMDWAYGLRINELGQVYLDSPLRSAFRNPTVEDASVILNSVGVIEHLVPNHRRRTYVIDPHREAHQLLQRNRPGTDGKVRNLHARG